MGWQVGRTGRAGAGGKVSSLVDPGSKELASTLRDALEADEPMEGAFSRNRSFRHKMRRYGRFVPRGQTA